MQASNTFAITKSVSENSKVVISPKPFKMGSSKRISSSIASEIFENFDENVKQSSVVMPCGIVSPISRNSIDRSPLLKMTFCLLEAKAATPSPRTPLLNSKELRKWSQEDHPTLWPLPSVKTIFECSHQYIGGDWRSMREKGNTSESGAFFS